MSAWSAPTVLVTKKDGTTRFCVDYRRLNARTKKDAFPLPRIDESLSGQAWFSTLDLASGYWQVRLSEDAKPKTAFATHSGLFKFAVMPFGLCNAPATFERLMSQVMRGLHWKRCLVFIDNILVFGNDFESALHSLELVLIRVAEYGLQLKSTKCNLFRTSVPFLGHIVGRAGLECDPNKLSAVANWIPPNTIKGVREFLGFTGYYRRFVPDYSTVAQPLVRLLGKDCKFKWTDACQDAFKALRALLIKTPVLAFPKEDLPYIVDTDTSDYGIGGVLSQCIEGTEHVIAYYSKSLNPAQQKYCKTRRELLAVVATLDHFKGYVWGPKFVVHTDHAALVWLTNLKNIQGMLARWLAKLQQFHFDIIHRPGVQHGNADGLSLCPQCERGTCAPNTDSIPSDPEPSWPDTACGTSIVVSTRAPSTFALTDIARSQKPPSNISQQPRSTPNTKYTNDENIVKIDTVPDSIVKTDTVPISTWDLQDAKCILSMKSDCCIDVKGFRFFTMERLFYALQLLSLGDRKFIRQLAKYSRMDYVRKCVNTRFELASTTLQDKWLDEQFQTWTQIITARILSDPIFKQALLDSVGSLLCDPEEPVYATALTSARKMCVQRKLLCWPTWITLPTRVTRGQVLA